MMNRKDFIKKGVVGGLAMATAPTMIRAKTVRLKESDYDKLMKPIGFNHLPNKEEQIMNKVIHRATTRGHANHGWLNSHHTFSFANYYNPERVHFGVLRVLNDDEIAPGTGFGTHPHDNMEIISIPLEGTLEHKDSMGNTSVIRSGEIQVMSAGTGIFHSEYNASKEEPGKFLQIWVFPREKNVTPRYDQIPLDDVARKNELYQVLSPNADDAGVWIHQDSWFHMGEYDQETSEEYRLKKDGNGVYAFVIEGRVEIDGTHLDRRDGIGISNTPTFNINAKAGAKVLLMEIPMTV
jgi:redox-sensitive bicupin YhaK (pirin superfamily)